MFFFQHILNLRKKKVFQNSIKSRHDDKQVYKIVLKALIWGHRFCISRRQRHQNHALFLWFWCTLQIWMHLHIQFSFSMPYLHYFIVRTFFFLTMSPDDMQFVKALTCDWTIHLVGNLTIMEDDRKWTKCGWWSLLNSKKTNFPPPFTLSVL